MATVSSSTGRSDDNVDDTPESLKSKDNKALSHLRGPDCLEAFQGQRAVISFTGGKDCHLALQRCVDAGLTVVCGATFFAPNHPPFQAHRTKWQQQQGDAMQLPIAQCCLTELESSNNIDNQDYKAAYASAIRKLHDDYQIQLIVTGDIDYVGTSTTNFMQQVCREQDCHGVQVLLPLWQQSGHDLLKEMLLQYEFDIRLCCVKSPFFDPTWIGRQLDTDMINSLQDKVKDGLDLTGENGEYHTMVVNGPMYRKNGGTPLQFVNVEAKELLQQPGQTKGERWWVMSETTKLEPL